ncbi:hypothetical protein [Brachybacterium sp. p3-SID957]|uniref:hypothetical protein n=1 Tax=Brachybacterium sp. p3-SID957 TaxID=2916049 RepID=UPI00223AA883|nr:hypothetical protein [Brachybacterium sp. p3-SID957]MCT1776760.1 hypothetical protein [Brachybacterium sp. p3-SID957]
MPTDNTIRIYCDRPGPFHATHGRTWFESFTRADDGSWGITPPESYGKRGTRVLYRPPGESEEQTRWNVRIPRHTMHRGEEHEPEPVGMILYDRDPLDFGRSVPQNPPPGFTDPLAGATITFNWQCSCRNALTVQASRLREPLGALVGRDIETITLDGLRYMLRP